MSAAGRIAVVGAGTMGAGVAVASARAGIDTVLLDVDDRAVAAGLARVERRFERAVARGASSPADAAAARSRVTTGVELGAASGADLIVEAVPEREELKRRVLARLGETAPHAVLATNTSSLSVGGLARDVPAPERVVGLHFFNPADVLPLVELVVTGRTADHAAAVARASAEAMGKTVVEVADGPGFVVNRCARPFYLEALRLVEDGVATMAQVDRICRLGGGFPMGPFELMDLVGIDVGLAVTESMWRQSHGEPRWRPSALQTRMVLAGATGRKAGRGFREGHAPEPRTPTDDAPARAAVGTVAIVGDDDLARDLRRLAGARGVTIAERGCAPDVLTIVTARPTPGGLERGPAAVLCDARPPSERRSAGACGFHALAPLEEGRLVELAPGPWTSPRSAAATESFFAALGCPVERVRDAPGLVLGRIVAQLVNEAAFAEAAGIATGETIDRAMTLGMRFPMGPVAWGRVVGPDRTVELLDALWSEDHDPRYRVAPALRRAGEEARA